MRDNIKSLMILILMLCLVMVGCTAEAPINDESGFVEENENNDSTFPREVVDGLGNKVIIEEKPKRIISGIPSNTEILYALGLEDSIIAVSDYCDYPAEALDKEKIGGYEALNTERIIELNPDIFFTYGNGDEKAVSIIEDSGITVVRFEPESIEEVFETINLFGEITGEEMKAAEIVEELSQKRDDILEKVKDREPISVFYEIWDEPLMAAGLGSFMDELITLAGGVNIARDAEGAYPIFSQEALVERNPEVYLVPADHVINFYNMTEDEKSQKINEVKSRPGYSEITAVKNNQVYLLEPNIVSRPSVRIVEGLELVARAIHPEAF